MTPRNKLIGASVAIVIILGFGTLGFKLLTEWSWFESFYFTLITITTIGYTEPADLTENGRYFGQEIAARDLDCVLIETEDKADPIESEGYRILNVDATNEEVLKTAGIERARGVVCAVSSDPENLYITLTARDLNPEIYIVARANEASVIPRLTRGRGQGGFACHFRIETDGADAAQTGRGRFHRTGVDGGRARSGTGADRDRTGLGTRRIYRA